MLIVAFSVFNQYESFKDYIKDLQGNNLENMDDSSDCDSVDQEEIRLIKDDLKIWLTLNANLLVKSNVNYE